MPFIKLLWSLVPGLFYLNAGISQEHLLRAENGTVNITSDAPLEWIAAESHSLRGIIDPAARSFAFTMRINSFEGFNSEMQQTHFLENYMEQQKYPNATFKGKFIEEIPFDQPGVYSVRAKGMLEVHGVARERIIKGTLEVANGQTTLRTSFLVPVSDHGINIPKIVAQKIAEEIRVDIHIQFRGT